MDSYRGKTMGRHREKTAIYGPRGEASGETSPADALISEVSRIVRKYISVV